MKASKKTWAKAFTLVEVIIVALFTVIVILSAVALINLINVQKSNSKTEYDIQSTFRSTSDTIASEIRKAGQVVMLLESSFNKNNLELGWDYIGIEASSIPEQNNIVHYKYNTIKKNHTRKVLAKSEKNTSYALDFKKSNSEDKNKLLEFKIEGYVNGNTIKPNQKLVSEVEAINTSKIAKDISGTIFVDSDGNSIVHAVKFTKVQLPKVNVWITLVLDKSASMQKSMSNTNLSRTKVLRKAVSELLLISNQNPNIEINIVPFDNFARGDGIWYNAEYNADILRDYFDYSDTSLSNKSNPLHQSGNTNIGDGIRVGYGNLLTRSANETDKDVKRYFIIFSDGESNMHTIKTDTNSYLGTIGNRTQIPSNYYPAHNALDELDEILRTQAYKGIQAVWNTSLTAKEPFDYAKAVADSIDPNFVKTYLIGIPGVGKGDIKLNNFNALGVRLRAKETVLAEDSEKLEDIFKIIAEDAIDR